MPMIENVNLVHNYIIITFELNPARSPSVSVSG